MQALVGLFCFSLLLATGTCLECEHCFGLNKDCSGKLNLCNEDQDTCATILTETIIGKMSSFTIAKTCYQASKCLRSSKGDSFMKVNVNIECSSSSAGKMESEGGKAPVQWSNELPNNQLLAEVFDRPKPRAADLNPRNIKLNATEETGATNPPIEPTNPPIEPTNPPIEPTNPPIESTNPPIEPTNPPIEPTNPPIEPTNPPIEPTNPPIEPTNPPIEPTNPPIEPTNPPIEPTNPPIEPTNPPIEPTNPPIEPTNPPIEPTNPPIEPTNPPIEPTNPPIESTNSPIEPTDPPSQPTDPPSQPTDTTVKTTKSTTKKPDPVVTTTTGDNAHQTVASFLLALSSLLLMNIFL